jgi:hypothetical protein
MSSLSDLGQRVADLYKEIVTTTVRFDGLSRETSTIITEVKTAVQRVDERMQQMHLDHVRERAEQQPDQGARGAAQRAQRERSSRRRARCRPAGDARDHRRGRDSATGTPAAGVRVGWRKRPAGSQRIAHHRPTGTNRSVRLGRCGSCLRTWPRACRARTQRPEKLKPRRATRERRPGGACGSSRGGFSRSGSGPARPPDHPFRTGPPHAATGSSVAGAGAGAALGTCVSQPCVSGARPRAMSR